MTTTQQIQSLKKLIAQTRSELDDCQEHFAKLRESQIQLERDFRELKTKKTVYVLRNKRGKRD